MVVVAPHSPLVLVPQLRVRVLPPLAQQLQHQHFSTSGGGMSPELRKRMDALADLFVEARDEIEMADESKGTTYFDEEAGAAQEAVDAALAEYADILGSLEEPERGEFQRGNGLKMEQLKAEIEILLHDDDH